MANLKSRAALAALAMIAAGLLSACGGNPIKNAVDNAVENAVEGGVEKAMEDAVGDDVNIDVNTDGSSVDLPSDFPSGIILPDGAILNSTYSDPGSGWNLAYSMTSSGPADDLVAAYKADSSWNNSYESVSAEMSSWIFDNGTHQVVFLSIGDADEYIMSLTVTALPE